MSTAPERKPIRVAIAEQIERQDDTDCWVWIGRMRGNGRDQAAQTTPALQLRVGDTVTDISVRRFLYKEKHPRIRPGQHVYRTCDNPRCVSPEHADTRRSTNA